MGRTAVRKPNRLGVPVALFIALVAIYFFLHSNLFNITRIEVTGEQTLSPAEISALSGLSTGVNIFEVDTQKSSRLVKTHPRIKECSVLRHLPSRLEIRVVERKPWAVIPTTHEFLLVDNQGVVMEKLTDWPPQPIPVVTSDLNPAKPITLGQKVKGVATVYRIAQVLPVKNMAISEYHYDIDSGEVTIYTLAGTEIRVGDANNLEAKAAAWPEIVKLLSKPKRPVMYVDLRFKGHPVIRYKGNI